MRRVDRASRCSARNPSRGRGECIFRPSDVSGHGGGHGRPGEQSWRGPLSLSESPSPSRTRQCTHGGDSRRASAARRRPRAPAMITLTTVAPAPPGSALTARLTARRPGASPTARSDPLRPSATASTQPRYLKSRNGRLFVRAASPSWARPRSTARPISRPPTTASSPGRRWSSAPATCCESTSATSSILRTTPGTRTAGETNLHTHGFHVSPRRPSDNIFVVIDPGKVFRYRYQIPRDHPPGFYWYHPHLHGQTNVQVSGGMAGAIIVKGGLDGARGLAQDRDPRSRDQPDRARPGRQRSSRGRWGRSPRPARSGSSTATLNPTDRHPARRAAAVADHQRLRRLVPVHAARGAAVPGPRHRRQLPASDHQRGHDADRPLLPARDPRRGAVRGGPTRSTSCAFSATGRRARCARRRSPR